MYLISKFILSLGVIICTTRIGILLSKKYIYRLEELDEFKNSFLIIENKINYTYEPLEEIFKEVAKISNYKIANFYKNVAENIKQKGAEKSWKDEIQNLMISLKKEDKEVLNEYGTLLGKTNREGQINQLKFSNTLLDRQIEIAKKDREKNEMIYKKLGIILGMMLVIILI